MRGGSIAGRANGGVEDVDQATLGDDVSGLVDLKVIVRADDAAVIQRPERISSGRERGGIDGIQSGLRQLIANVDDVLLRRGQIRRSH
jgi:hypothetical protein